MTFQIYQGDAIVTRASRPAILREIARHYEVDGIEMDFIRFCFHLPRPATAEQIEIIARIVRSARPILDSEAKGRGRRGRPILEARMAPSIREWAPNGLAPEILADGRSDAKNG